MWEWHFGLRSANRYFVYMQPVTTQQMYNNNKKENIIHTEDQSCEWLIQMWEFSVWCMKNEAV